MIENVLVNNYKKEFSKNKDLKGKQQEG